MTIDQRSYLASLMPMSFLDYLDKNDGGSKEGESLGDLSKLGPRKTNKLETEYRMTQINNFSTAHIEKEFMGDLGDVAKDAQKEADILFGKR